MDLVKKIIDVLAIQKIVFNFKSKYRMMVIEEDDMDFELPADLKQILDVRLEEDEETYLTAEDSINMLIRKYSDQSR